MPVAESERQSLVYSASDGNLDTSTSSSSDDDDDDDRTLFSPIVNSLGLYNLHPKDGDYSKFKKELEYNLRIGSAYHIGTSNNGNFNPLSDIETQNMTSRAFSRHPFNLLLAREQGDIGPSSKCRVLRYRASQWVVDGSHKYDGLQIYGNRSNGTLYPDPQTFQERVQGSLWAVNRLHLENKFKCHRGCVNSLNFNTRGNLIASGSDDLKVVVTDWITREEIYNYRTGHCMNIFHVKFIPESNDLQIVSCACDSEVRLANLSPSGGLAAPTRLLVKHNRACHKLAIPENEPHTILSAGADGQVFSIDLRIPKANKLIWLPFSEFFSISCNPVRPHEIALSGRSESIVRIYDRRKIDKRDPNCGLIYCLGAEHLRGARRQPNIRNPKHIMSDSQTNHISDSESDSDETEDSVNFLNSLSVQLGRRVRAVLTNLRGRARAAIRMNTNNNDDNPTSDPSYNFEVTKYSVTTAVYSAQGDAILLSYNDEDIYLFDVNEPNKSYLHKYSGHRNMQTIVSAAFFGPNSEYIISGSDDGYFYMWDRESEGIVQWLHADTDGAVNVIESHPTLPIIATAGLDYDFKVWSPIRPLFAENDKTMNHLKYASSRIPSDILRLRRSRLGKSFFSEENDNEDVSQIKQKKADEDVNYNNHDINNNESKKICSSPVNNSSLSPSSNSFSSDISTNSDIYSLLNNPDSFIHKSTSEKIVEKPVSNENKNLNCKSRKRPHPDNDNNKNNKNNNNLTEDSNMISIKNNSNLPSINEINRKENSELENDHVFNNGDDRYTEVHNHNHSNNNSDKDTYEDDLPTKQPKRSICESDISTNRNSSFLIKQDSNLICDGNNNPKFELKSDININHATDLKTSINTPNTITMTNTINIHINNQNTTIDTPQPRLPSHLLPFDQKDLQLRVAQNWVNRACENSQLDGLNEVNFRILSAIESVAQIHTRTTNDSDDELNLSDSSSYSEDSRDTVRRMRLFLTLRRFRPNNVEPSEESLATRDRDEGENENSSDDINSSSITNLLANELNSCITDFSSSSSSSSSSSTSSSSSSSADSSTSSTSTLSSSHSSTSSSSSSSTSNSSTQTLTK